MLNNTNFYDLSKNKLCRGIIFVYPEKQAVMGSYINEIFIHIPVIKLRIKVGLS